MIGVHPLNVWFQSVVGSSRLGPPFHRFPVRLRRGVGLAIWGLPVFEVRNFRTCLQATAYSSNSLVTYPSSSCVFPVRQLWVCFE